MNNLIRILLTDAPMATFTMATISTKPIPTAVGARAPSSTILFILTAL